VSEADILHLACLAPMAVKPSKQRKGIGAALIRRGLEMIRELRFPGVVLVGQPEYYARFGFSAANAAALECPYSGPYLQALELTPRAVRGLGRASLKLAGPLMPGE
jgi:putative acetyltransferase